MRRVTFEQGSRLEVLENYAFSECTSLKTIALPDTLTTIGENCFSRSGLNEIRIPENIKIIESNAFSECKDLYMINLANNSLLSEIKNQAF